MVMNRALLILFCMLTINRLSGQNAVVIDSLIVRLEATNQDSSRSRLMFDLASELLVSDTVRTFRYLNNGKKIAEKLEDTEGLGRYYKILGKVRLMSGDYRAAILDYDRALAYLSESANHVKYYETIKEKGNAYLFLSEYDQAVNLYNTALDFYMRNHMPIGVSRCLNNLGIIHKNRGDYAKALYVYEESVRYLDSIVHAYDICQAYINMGNVFVYLGTYERALEYFHKALVIAEREGYKQNRALCLANSGVVQNKIHNYEEALNLYKRSLTESQTINDPMQVSNCLINIGTNYADMGEPEKGLEYVERGLAIRLELGDTRVISNCHIHMAEIHCMLQSYDKATELFNLAIPVKEQLGDQEGLVRCYLGLGSVMLENNQYTAAWSMANQALGMALELNTKEHIAVGYDLKQKVASKRGDYKSAYKFAMLYHQYNDSLMDEATSKAGMEMEFRNRSKMLQQENENLRIQSNLNTVLMRKREVILNFIVGITLILAIGLMLVVYFLRKLKHSSQKLEEQNLVIIRQNLKLDHLNTTKDRIMSIIAHDLRGTIGNQLTAVEVLHRIEGDNNVQIDRRKLLGNLKHSASYSLELLENLLHWSRLEEKESHYHPEEVNLNSLITNCLALFDEAARNKGLHIETCLLDDIRCSVDRIMMETIYRNLISNAIKFTNGGGTITIKSGKEEGEIIFRVIDEGIGMTPEQIDKVLNNGGFTRRGTNNEKGAGMGLTLVQEFAKIHNGQLKITSQPNEGSSIEVIIPCRN